MEYRLFIRLTHLPEATEFRIVHVLDRFDSGGMF